MKSYKMIMAGILALAAVGSLPARASESGDEIRGRYIYVPDSLQGDVLRLLEGHSKVVDDETRINMTEKVVHKGDTIPMVLRDRNLGRFDRGLFNFLYVPKGMWTVGLTASYGEFNTEDLEIFGLLSDIDVGASSFSINPYFAYFIRNNMSVGMRFGYTNTRGAINSFKVDIDADMNFNLHDIVYRAENYTAALNFRQYLGIGRRGRFGIFNEVELALGSGKSVFSRPYAGEVRTTEATNLDARLNFSPGVQVFIMKNVDFHLSLGVFGFYLKHERQSEDGVHCGSRTTSGANFRLNIFNLNFGIGVTL